MPALRCILSKNQSGNRDANANIPYIELYQRQMETGEVHTHDYPLLARLNDKYGYLREAKEYEAQHAIHEKFDF